MDGYVFYLIRKFFENCINNFLQVYCDDVCEMVRKNYKFRRVNKIYTILLTNKINEVEMH